MLSHRDVLLRAQQLQNQFRDDEESAKLYRKRLHFLGLLRWIGFNDPELGDNGRLPLDDEWEIGLESFRHKQSFSLSLFRNDKFLRTFSVTQANSPGMVLASMQDWIDYLEGNGNENKS